MKTLEIGTILEPKFDRNIEHAIVIGRVLFWSGNIEGIYSYHVRTIKSKNEIKLIPYELFKIYEPIGQSNIGKALFGE